MRFENLDNCSKRRIVFCIVFLVLLTAAIRIPLLSIPFERDEGEYAYIGWRLGHGELPYRDWFDQKPPAIFWIYHAALSQPLNSIIAVHLFGSLFSAATACAIFLLAKKFMNWFWSLAASTLFVLLAADPLLNGPSANTELFMLFPMVVSIITFVRFLDEKNKVTLIVLTGLFLGMASAFKQVAIMNWFFMAAMVPVFAQSGKRLRQTILFSIYSVAGVLAVWMAIGVYFAVKHSWHDFICDVFTHNFEYVGAVLPSQRWHYFLSTAKSLLHDEWLIWIFVVAGMISLAHGKRWKFFLFFAAWIIANAMGVNASGYFFPHYFQQLLPMICLAAAIGLEMIERFIAAKSSILLRRLFLVSVPLVLPAISIFPFLFIYSPDTAIDKIYPGNHFAAKRELAARLSRVTKSDDRVYIFGAEPEILFYARRESATRYIFLFPLYGPYSDVAEKQIATATEISSNRPAAIVYSPNELLFHPGTDQYLTQWTQSYMKTNFYADTYLGWDSSGVFRVITNVPKQKSSTLNGFEVIGEIDIRNPKK